MNYLFMKTKTPKSVTEIIVKNVKLRRKEKKLSQSMLAKKADVSLGSLKRFETLGEISFSSLIKIAIVLDCVDDFLLLFSHKKYNSIEEIIKENET